MGDTMIRDLKVLEPIIERAVVCRIGFCHNDVPYVVPMNFGYRDGCVYLHSSFTGKKIDILRENKNVCFEVDIDHAIRESEIACKWGMKFRSVIGFGRATLVEDIPGKIEALDAIMDHYSNAKPRDYDEKLLDKVAVIKIELEEVTARLYGYDEA